jgi:16S rRNA (cytosine967-C5)-methyltransferase
LERHYERQAALLRQGAALVRPGGRLVYATCSLLPSENERPVEAFLAEHAEFQATPVETVWAEAIGGESPFRGRFLALTPLRHGTDGFFAAMLQRSQ